MSFEACAELVRQGDKARFYAAMTAPLEKRGALMAVYAFNLEVSRAPWVTKEPMIAQMRLQWWLDAIEEIFEGKKPRAHEVVIPLAQVMETADLPRARFVELIQARRFDIAGEPHENKRSFLKYIHQTNGHLLALSCDILHKGTSQLPGVKNAGFAFGTAALFRGTPALIRANHWPFWKMDLSDNNGIGTGKAGPTLNRVIEGLANEALEALSQAHKSRLPKILAPALRSGHGSKTVLTTAINRPQSVLDGQLEPSRFQHKLGFLGKSLIETW